MKNHAFFLARAFFNDRYCRASHSFLIWSGGCSIDPNSVTQADKRRIVGGITRAEPQSNRPPGEHEAIGVFSAQQLHHPTVSAFRFIEEDVRRRPPPLPSGYSGIDHLTAFTLSAPDCHDLYPHFQRFRDNRLPPPRVMSPSLPSGRPPRPSGRNCWTGWKPKSPTSLICSRGWPQT